MTMMKKRHILHWAMGVIMTPLLGSCAFDELHEIAGGGNGVLSFGVEVNAGAPEVKPMGGATRSGDRADSSASGGAVMSSDVEGFFPTSSVELSSVDGKTLYANCDERSGINMHNNVDYKATRGSIQTTNNFYNSFALYGYVYDSGSSFTNSTPVNSSINGIQMTKNGSEYKASNVYWPGAGKKATFFAVAPSTAKSNVSADQGGPKITYTVQKSVESQEDLLVAMATDVICDGKNAPQLTFNHALAAIRFELGDLPASCTVKNVEISGVFNKGDLSSFESPAWSNQSIDGSGTNTYTITDLNNVMFLMPQTFTDDAQIKLTLNDDSYYIAKLKDGTNTSWQAGHQYTYKLSVNKVTGTFNFEVTSSTTSVTKDYQGEVSVTVKSYFQYSDGSNTKMPIPWTAKYTIDGSEKSISGNGSINDAGETAIVSITKNISTSSTHTQYLQNATPQGSAGNPFNLADPENKGTDQNTANCYVISAPGVYKLPLVYGNGIKNGTTNNSCYNTSSNYMNHAGTQISSLMPYIYGHGYNPEVGSNGAEIVWTSSENLITNAKISDDGHYLVFTVDKSTIQQGNAVVAAKYNNTIVWSWHIWVTDTPLLTYTYGSYNFLNMPLGFVDGSSGGTCQPRNINVSFTQSVGSATKSLTISQAGDAVTSSTALFYQWGRKDPFRTSGNTLNLGVVAQSTAIQNPNIFYKGNPYNWSQQIYNNGYDYWNVGNSVTSTTQPVNKSIYDPSPAGYKLPPCDAFSSLKMNTTVFKWSTKGYSNTSNNDFWHALGLLTYDGGSLSRDGTRGYYWSASPYNTYSGCNLHFYEGYVRPQDYDHRAYGFSVRPVSE